MGLTLVLHLPGGDIPFTEYTSLDINRNAREAHINATNDKQDFAFNKFYEKILTLKAPDSPFPVTVKQEKGEAIFNDITVDYFLNAGVEVLHFTTLKQTDGGLT